MKILEDFEGSLQTDGFSAYTSLVKNNSKVRDFCCWAHGRRYFKEAQPDSKERAGKVLKFLQKIYRVEKAS